MTERSVREPGTPASSERRPSGPAAEQPGEGEVRSDVGLRATHEVVFSYRRSVGGATEQFLAGLARGEVLASRVGAGRVLVPPVDHDPATGIATGELVRVADAGIVRSWTWVPSPRAEHPLDGPFAFALVQLDGADTALLHVVDVPDEQAMETGMRVRADWRAARTGSVLDIRAFVPEAQAVAAVAAAPEPEPLPIEVPADMRLEYAYEPGLTLSAFLRTLAERRIVGGRCPSCGKVYVPPHVRCVADGAGPMEPVELGDRGTLLAYTVVHLPFHGMVMELPFAWGMILLDGADVPFAHLLGDVALDDIRVDQRVAAVWMPDDELAPTWEAIRHFRPITDQAEGSPE
jgi:uncharacterized OB-fold protein